MSLRYGILNLSVLIIIILLASKTYKIWTEPIDITIGKETARKSVNKVEIPKIAEGKKEPSNNSSSIIYEKNIFSPERKDFPTQSGPEGKKPVVRPQIILHGVTIATDYQSASISNPGRLLRKGEREAMTLKIGDRIGEYKLAKILPDRISLEAVEDSFEVLLHDSNKPKQRIYAKTETKPAAITTILPTSTVSSTTSSVSSQITRSQDGTKVAETTRESATKTKLPETSSLPPYPQPTLRSRRASTEPSPSTPTGPPETLTRSKNP